MKVEDKDKADPGAVMDAFRLARSGNYTTAKQLRNAFAELYPELTKEQTAHVFAKLAEYVR